MAEEDSAPSAPTRSTDLLEAFWKFLALTEVVDAEVIEEYRSQYADKWMPLTTILVEEGVIEANQVAMLLRKQFSEPHMRLGDLAVREEFCTREAEAVDEDIEILTSMGPFKRGPD